MFEKPQQWLEKHWWGLIVAHLIVLGIVYLLIWQFAEPLGIPDSLANLPTFVNTRVFFHLILTLILGAYITLILDLILLRKKWTSAKNFEYGWLIVGTWKGEYENIKGKRREATLKVYLVNNELKAEIYTLTDQGPVIQKADIEELDSKIGFNLVTKAITTDAERRTKWRPEIWKCRLSKDVQGHERVTAEIGDITSKGVDRTITEFNLYRIDGKG